MDKDKEEKEFEELRNKMGLLELHISRVPRHTKKWFVDYANDYFEGDYGCCLKHVIDSFRGMTPIGYEELQVQITELQHELELVKGLINKPEDKKLAKTMQERIDQTKTREG